MAKILQRLTKRNPMDAKDKIYDPRTFDEEALICPHCGWKGNGSETHVAGFYGLSKYKEVLCPNCSEYLGNLSRDPSYGQSHRFDSRSGPV
jgi:predicted RNA-binding Zn-ribbon protein involved in translation (DUF1610 family)